MTLGQQARDVVGQRGARRDGTAAALGRCMETQPIPVAAATNLTPATVETPCRFCRRDVPLTDTGMLYRRDGKIVAVACIPCAYTKRDRA